MTDSQVRFGMAATLTSKPGGLQGDNKGFLVARQKMHTSLERLCHRFSPPFQKFLEYAISLQYKEAPNYRACQALFEPLLGDPSTRPLAVDFGAASGKVGCIPPYLCRPA